MNEDTPLLARSQELERLDMFLDRALAGEGQMCLISGRAGTGKTFLVSEFVQRAQERNQDIVVSIGNCDVQSGNANPYLPFREALNLLIGDVDERVVKTLITHENLRRISQITLKVAEILIDAGPDLIGLLVPGGELMTKLATQAAKLGKSSLTKFEAFKKLEKRLQSPTSVDPTGKAALDQNQIYEQCTNLLCKLAKHKPLILVLDDLHWADAASVGLLFRLGRRLSSSPILVVGTYRPEEITFGGDDERHPLAKTIIEFKRYFGDISVDLDQAADVRGAEFIDAFLDNFPNQLDRSFRDKLYLHTHGHPLFTVEIVRELQQHGGLVQSKDEAWVASNNLTWDALPSRIEGVVEERCMRLDPALREHLTVGSVEGDRFTAEVVAKIGSTDVRGLIRLLSNVAQDEQYLIEAAGVQRVAGNRLANYGFTSSVIRKYLYASLDEIERTYMHEDVGNALETLYGSDAHTIAVQLAYHFDQAGMPEKALPYLRLAGDQAAVGYAHAEAVCHYSRALELTTASDIESRYQLLSAREHAFSMLGNRSAQVNDLDEMLKLAQASNDAKRQAEVTLRRSAYGALVGDFENSLADAQAATVLAEKLGDSVLNAWSLIRGGSAYWQLGHYAEARKYLEQALEKGQALEHPEIIASAHNDLGIIDYYEEHYPAALDHLEIATAQFATLNDRKGEARCMSLSGMILDVMGEHGTAKTKFADALVIAQQVGWRYGEARLLNQSGDNLIQLGLLDTALNHLQQSLAISREVEDVENLARTLDMCGLAALFQRHFDDARNYLDEALGLHRKAENQRGQGFVLTHLGQLLIETEEWEAAVETLQQAWEIRRKLEAKSSEIDTVAALAKLALRLDDKKAANEYVAEILAWLEKNGVQGIEFPIQVYLTCYEVLLTAGTNQERANKVLSDAHALLMERADRLDTKLRTQYLENVLVNRALQQHWSKQQG